MQAPLFLVPCIFLYLFLPSFFVLYQIASLISYLETHQKNVMGKRPRKKTSREKKKRRRPKNTHTNRFFFVPSHSPPRPVSRSDVDPAAASEVRRAVARLCSCGVRGIPGIEKLNRIIG